MRKLLPIIIVFLLLTLSMTPLTTAQKQNIITNKTTETLYVISSTKYGAQDDIPAGYRTSGWKTIAAGQQRAFNASDPDKIYFQIWKGSQPIKPQPATDTFAFWINRSANFDIVTQHAINTDITRVQLVYSSHDTSVLTHSNGFMSYDNGSRITVTNAWVDVDTPVSIPDPNLVENTVTNALPITIYVTFATWQPADADVPAEGYRTSGYYPIPRGGSRTFHAAEDEPIFFRFQRLDPIPDVGGYAPLMYLSPAADTATISSWVPLEYYIDDPVFLEDGTALLYPIGDFESLTYKSFNIATPMRAVFGAATFEQITFTDLPEDVLEKDDGFIKYRNGSDITVTDEWYVRWGGKAQTTEAVLEEAFATFSPGDVVHISGKPLRVDYLGDEDDIEDDFLYPTMKESTVTNQLPITIYVTFATWLPPDDRFPEEGLRTQGYYAIPPGDSHVFHAAEDAPIYFRFQRLDKFSNYANSFNYLTTLGRPRVYSLAPQPLEIDGDSIDDAGVDFESLTFKSFYIVSEDIWDPSGNTVKPVRPDFRGSIFLRFTDVPVEHLHVSAGFHEYTSGSHITVTREWWLVLDASLNTSSRIMSAYDGLAALDGPPVNIPDPNLRTAITSKLSKGENDPISEGEMQNLRFHLDLSKSSIADLTGLEFASNLQGLKFHNNAISDVSPLRDLVNLEALDLGNNAISDVSPLKNLVNLTRLDLGNNAISDVSSLKDLVNLETLFLFGNHISDVSPLKDLVKLEYLYLSGNAISDVSPLKDLVKLEYLYLSGNAISDVSPLKDLVNLKALNLGNNSISDVSPLKDLVNLESLDIRDNPVRNADQLSHLTAEILIEPALADGGLSDLPVSIPDPNLRSAIVSALGKNENAPIFEAEMRTLPGSSLNLRNHQIADLTGLNLAKSLKYLYLLNNSISDVSPLKNLVNLEQLDLSHNAISDVSPLKDLVNLKALNLGNNSISDASPLKDLIKLETLSLNSNSISDVSPLKNLVNLEYLNLSSNSISDVSPLKDLIKLETLLLNNNGISDVSPLKNLVNLETLRLAHNPVRNADVLSHLDVSLHSEWTLLRSLETPGRSMRDIAFAGRNSDTFFFVANENEIHKARIEGESWSFLEGIKVNSDIIDLRIPQENPHFVAVLKENEYVNMYYTSDLTPRGTSFEGSRGKHKDSVYAMDVSGNGERLVIYGDNRQNRIFNLPVTERILWKFDVSAPQTRFYSGVVISKSKGKVPLPTHIETIAVNFDGKYVYYTGNDGVYSWYGTRFYRRYGASEDQHGDEGGFRPINQQAFQSDAIAYDYPYMVAGYQNPWRRKIIVWDVVNNVSYRTWDISGHIHNIAINGDIVAAIVGSTIYVFNIATDTQEEIYLNVPAASIAIGGGGDYIAVSGTRWDPVNDTISGGLAIARRSVAGAPAAKPASEQPLVETRLGTNYPNPFNPETWIPYNLAKSSEVALTIYAIDGKVVRRLDLGHQDAGYYQSKARAAYWDSRNHVGERVASGLYFYTLTAGDFSATRKMLIRK